MTSAAGYWDRYFHELDANGGDLDWGGRWTEPFFGPLRRVAARSVLELGCGTGNDAMRLAGEDYSVTATDLSVEAVRQAQMRFGDAVEFFVVDMTSPLPFRDGVFDAVMSNVAFHRFSDSVTRSLFAEVGRVVRAGGLFLFHVNAVEDRPLRARRLPVVREIDDNYVIEANGQPMRFFSAAYLRALLQGWRDVQLDLVEITDDGGELFKCVWRGVAHRPSVS